MATQSELEHSAGEHARKTSWSLDKYLLEIRNNKDYAYKNTEWYRAGADLEKTKVSAPPPSGGGSPPPTGNLATVQARIFLAQEPLDALAAPAWMIPVCTADHGYRHYYTADVIHSLRMRFSTVETWCDCRIPSGYVEGEGTGYDEAVKMSNELGLDGAWGQCESQGEFDNAYAAGCRRMVGSLSALNSTSLDRVAKAEVLVTNELYRNCQPWQLPDWRNANAGVGGNCIAVYADSTPCYYTPVQQYKDEGFYHPGPDSVYGVGLSSADWAALG